MRKCGYGHYSESGQWIWCSAPAADGLEVWVGTPPKVPLCAQHWTWAQHANQWEGFRAALNGRRGVFS